MELTLLLAALTGVLSAWVGTRLWPERIPDHPIERLLGAVTIGLFSGRIVEMLLQGVNPLTHPLEIVFVRGGVHTGIAALGFIVTLAWSLDWEPGPIDALAPAVLAGLAGWHAGCLWRGACLGTVSDLPWAWSAAGSTITRHPVEIYAAAGLVAGAWLVGRLSWRSLVRAGTALAIAGLVRLATEPLRLSLDGGPTVWYAAAAVLGLAAVLTGPRLIDRRAGST